MSKSENSRVIITVSSPWPSHGLPTANANPGSVSVGFSGCVCGTWRIPEVGLGEENSQLIAKNTQMPLKIPSK